MMIEICMYNVPSSLSHLKSKYIYPSVGVYRLNEGCGEKATLSVALMDASIPAVLPLLVH